METDLKQRQQLCKDLELLCSEDINFLEYILDEYVYLLDDTRVKELIKLCDEELED